MTSCPSHSDPIAVAHHAIQQPNASVESVISNLNAPEREAIPLITDPSSKVGGWVRYTAMVQDVWDPELFVASSPDGKSGFLVEDAAASDHPNVVLAERLPIYLVSIPGQSSWVRKIEKRNTQTKESSLETNNNAKRSREENDSETVKPFVPVSASRPPPHNAPSDKRLRPTNVVSRPENPVSIGLNNPVRNQPGASAVVAKIYGNASRSELKINSTVEVIGILQDGLNVPHNTTDAEEAAFAAEFLARNPTNVKRIHVVSMREVGEWELNPLTAKLGPSGVTTARAELQQVIGGMRDILVRYLASALCGDVLAAEYVLACLLSRPVRTAGSLLGKLSLNIVFPSGVAQKNAADLIRAIKNIHPTVVNIDLSIAGLNSQEFFPRKDYRLNRLRAGVLQMTNGSCFVGNETLLSNGQLSERGVKNVRALTALSQRCQSPIDFEYYEAEVPLNCSSIIITSGGKSIIPTDVVVRVKENAELDLQQWDSYDDTLLNRMRLALALLVEDGKFDITKEATLAIENEYVEARRRGEAKDGQESLQLWLGIGRGTARSFAETTLSEERWKYTRLMENRRRERMQRS